MGCAEGARLGPGTVDELLADFEQMPPDLGSSIPFDRIAGRRLEWEARNGVIRRLGALHGIATPVSDTLVPLLAALDPLPAAPPAAAPRSTPPTAPPTPARARP